MRKPAGSAVAPRQPVRMVFALGAVWAVFCGTDAHAAVDPAVRQKLAVARVPFVPNDGQWDAQVAFAAQSLAGTLFVATDGRLVYSQPGKVTDSAGRDAPGYDPAPRRRSAARRTAGLVLTESFVDADGQSIPAVPVGHRKAGTTVNFFTGEESRHRRDLATFEGVDLGDVFPGINVRLRATGNNVEKIFTVAPEQDPGRIRLRVDGATGLEIGMAGELVAHTGNGPVTFTAPVAFQDNAHGQRQPVDVRYALHRPGTDHAGQYGFVLGTYDTTLPLVIDPLLRSTYHGGTGLDLAQAVVVHPTTGDVYVAGFAMSTTFPGANGTNGNPGSGDAYVSRFSGDLETLISATYLGASGIDNASSIVVHPASGDVYVAGYTDNGTAFPGVAGGARSGRLGDSEGFVARVSADLSTVINSTYIGLTGGSDVTALAIHPMTGDVYVAGYNDSPTSSVAGVSLGAQGTHGGGFSDAFVSRFAANLATQVKFSYLGAGGDDYAHAMAIHPVSGDVYVVGDTTSTGSTFPGVTGSAQGTYGGSRDAFVSRFSADLGTLIKSSYLGAASTDVARALAVHQSTGDVYVAGETSSTTSTFPGVSGSAQGSTGGGFDAFVSRFSADLLTLSKSSYLGAALSDVAQALAIHPLTGDVYVAGATAATTTTFPGVSGGAQGTTGGGTDAFIARLNATLTVLTKSTYLGGSGSDRGNGLAIHPVRGDIYLVGETSSSNFPGVAGAVPGLGVYAGNGDAFVSRVSLDLLAIDQYPNPFAFPAVAGLPPNIIRTSAPVLITGLATPAPVSVSGATGSAYCISSGNLCNCDASPGNLFTAVPSNIANNQFLCVQHVSAPVANDLRTTLVLVGGGAAKFQTFTGTNLGICSLDVDGNGSKDALTDGLIIIRALFGLTGTAVTSGAVGSGATRGTWATLQPFLNGNCGTSFAP